MVSAPSPSIPAPDWTRRLIWRPTPPFRLEWRSGAEIAFAAVAHLKNGLNGGKAVLVGRDGQEVEAGCGVGLVEGLGWGGVTVC